ncbi:MULTISPECIES: glycosyltransferase family 4 protein [Caballeronia]|jgi:glycosyltransferase involved in cell wall biosynthesis|uniref:glycosyltransferase family 4 protein n=1 Tax=Caballeronia TaxID=1827195 RepID=UPI00025BAB8A|nr:MULTISPECIES: glycosyltransferase family 4 protein [Caballeronia]EKS68256.1 group 1 glycosyl transferase [Burkholderia sp. SJ98]MDR5764660.1 glycosyltransferase family 4 protein [Caballeronia sp. LZ028]MDR5787799.1 glycosyltransferase family 4 protein [Caballeronia sp. LP003]
MRIGISANALKHSGGLERYAMDLVRGLAAAGFEGKRKPAFFARKIDTSLPESRLIEPHRIKVSFLPGKLRDAYFSWALKRARKKAKVDVLIGCNRVEGSEIAICGGTHIGFLRATGRREKPSDTRQIALERRQYAHANVVVAHSDMMSDELRALYGVDIRKIRVLYPPVDGARFSPVGAAARARLREQFGFEPDETVLLFPSSSHERKGLPLIEKALAGMNVVIAVAGRAPEKPAANVRYVGYAKNIEDAYRAADFTILASSYEPFGLVGIESVMSGTPVIFPACIGCCDAIADHAKHVFKPGDADDLRRTVQEAIEARRDAPRALAGAVRYDASVESHVRALLDLARDIDAKR